MRSVKIQKKIKDVSYISQSAPTDRVTQATPSATSVHLPPPAAICTQVHRLQQFLFRFFDRPNDKTDLSILNTPKHNNGDAQRQDTEDKTKEKTKYKQEITAC